MRALQLLTYGSALVLCSSLAMADNMSMVSVMSAAEQFVGVAVPGCGSATAGTSFAATSFSCNLAGVSYSGSATGQTGLGPYGIGVSMSAGAEGNTAQVTDPSYVTHSNVSLSWSQDFVIEGAQGNGFVTFDLAWVGLNEAVDVGGANISADLFGFSFSADCLCFELTKPINTWHGPYFFHEWLHDVLRL